MRLTSSRAYTRPQPVPKMPPGLMELMDGLAREVLMHNPSNVYEFCANHMEKLLEIRDGPSTNKSLTLEQKILKVQEKMRLKAQERRDKFDKEIKSWSINDTIVQDKRDDPLAPEDPVVPSPCPRAPIHHEIDLKNASELEISHASQIKKAPLSEPTDGDVKKINLTKKESGIAVNDNLMRVENQNTETISEEGQETEINCDKNIDDEPIFGKVENEVFESLKEPKREEIIDLAAMDSPLQTITEATEEGVVNDNVVILPKITIGDDERDLDSISDESRLEMQSDIINNEDIAEGGTEKISDVENKSKNNSNDVTENEIIIPDKTSEPEKKVLDLVENSGNGTGGSPSEKQSHDIKEVSETINDTFVVGTTEVNSGDSNVGEAVSNDYNTEVSVETHNNDNPNSEIPSHSALVPEVVFHDHSQSEILAIIPTQKDTGDTQTTAKDLLENSNVSEKVVAHYPPEDEANPKPEKDVDHVRNTTDNESELKADVEHVNIKSETEPNLKAVIDVEHLINADLNIKNVDAVEMEPEILQRTLKTVEENIGDDDKIHDVTENSLQKSDSIENTNEDSISMLDSDISKTDDDSTHNNPNMDLETAAVTIQKVFRSLMFKSRNSTFEDTNNDEHNSVDEDNDKKEEYYAAAANLNKERRPLGITRMDTVLQTVNEEKSLSLSTDDSSTLSSAATTIQAHVRGFLVRNRLNSSKTFSMNSLVNSHEVLEADPEQHKNKTILNIHIVPEEGNYLSRDESLITSMDLSLDGSPPSSVNLHPLSCDISERRKMLKREDAVQSVSPPSNNSGKQSEDSVKEVLINENGVLERESTDDKTIEDDPKELDNEVSDVVSSASTVTPTTIITISKSEDPIRSPRDNEATLRRNGTSLTKLSSDESDVITPYVASPRSPANGTKLIHSGEFHDVVLPTKVSRHDTTAVREFKNVLVYFLLWNNS